MLNIQGTNVTIMVSDMETALNFYTGTLGFHLKNRYGDHWADLKGPGIQIGLHPTDKQMTPGNNLQIGVRVPDMDLAIEELNKAGVRVLKQSADQVRLTPFHDPDGNTLYLYQGD